MSDFLALCVVFLCAVGKLYAVVSTISACDGETVSGNVINVQYKPCDADWNGVCIVEPTFTGDLRFTSTTNKSNCHTEVNISDTIDPDTTSIMPCGRGTSLLFNVIPTTALYMLSKTVNSTAVKLYREIRIFQENKSDDTISVTCGNTTSLSITTSERSTRTSGQDQHSLSTASGFSFSTEHTFASTTDDVSSIPIPVDSQPSNKDSDLTYIISGVSGFVVVLIIVICILIYCHTKRKHLKTDGKVDEYSVAYNPNNTGYLDELPDNPLYHSNLPFDEVEYSTVNDQRPDPSSKRQTEEVEEVTKDDTNDVYAKPNKCLHGSIVNNQSNAVTVSAENQSLSDDLNDEIVYAQVNKEAKA
ncbi:uncharacterized protein LOC125674855 [Ostrea edulis]|uniref:uncharacterized protein LOC125674855 n=1 Tax=Ostrea edulis TaxID=37623 RepID=UPI0024AF0157|nr:uncharacterized protein LOC125674855 [Ostrea edulis]